MTDNEKILRIEINNSIDKIVQGVVHPHIEREKLAEKLVKLFAIPNVVEPKGKLEMFQNMQYYMEHCQREGYITPQDWLEKEKHF